MHSAIDHDITALATARWASAHDARLAEIMQALVRHLHMFAREVRLTEAEWSTAMNWLARTGQISDATRAEFYLTGAVHDLHDSGIGGALLDVWQAHLFEKGAPYLDSDVVFGTKADLVVEFERHGPGPTPDGGTSEVPWLLARYDFALQRASTSTE